MQRTLAHLSTHELIIVGQQALGMGEGGADGSGSDEEPGEQPHPDSDAPPAYPALQARRDSVRGWLCALYAFAAPHRRVAAVAASVLTECHMRTHADCSM